MIGNGKYTKGFHDRLFLAWTLWEGRHRQRLTQAELGERVGRLRGGPVSQSTVNDWRNRIIPSVEDLQYLAAVLEVPAGWLAFNEGPGPDNPTLRGIRPVPRSKGR